MDKGGIYYSHQHEFEDGGISKKFLILLNNPDTSGTYIFTLTTTKGRNRKSTAGCHHDRTENYFVIDNETDWFNADKTWVLFSTLTMLNPGDILAETFKGNLKKKSQLKQNTFNTILNCLKTSQDISGHMIDIINK